MFSILLLVATPCCNDQLINFVITGRIFLRMMSFFSIFVGMASSSQDFADIPFISFSTSSCVKILNLLNPAIESFSFWNIFWVLLKFISDFLILFVKNSENSVASSSSDFPSGIWSSDFDPIILLKVLYSSFVFHSHIIISSDSILVFFSDIM